MAARSEQLFRHIRRLVARPASGPDSDAVLLVQFVRHRDQDAFAALVRRRQRGPLGAKRSLEFRRRIETILDKLTGGPRLRFLRALEVLEHIGTPEARQVLAALSQGSVELWPTQEAKALLARLAKRSMTQP